MRYLFIIYAINFSVVDYCLAARTLCRHLKWKDARARFSQTKQRLLAGNICVCSIAVSFDAPLLNARVCLCWWWQYWRR